MNAQVATAIDGNGAGRANQSVGSPLEVLFDGVDDLIRRLADTENPEIRKVRAKVHAALVAAKSEFAAKSAFEEVEAQLNHARGQAAQVNGVAAQVDGGADDLLRDYPAPALGVALLVGIGLGLVVSLRQ
ncbi:MAG TPA: hypothetical protein VNX69_08430 [Steroidobacteraceae bacterium]|nr:hypothetical protein [Steroidobacteraceae bacterium]